MGFVLSVPILLTFCFECLLDVKFAVVAAAVASGSGSNRAFYTGPLSLVNSERSGAKVFFREKRERGREILEKHCSLFTLTLVIIVCNNLVIIFISIQFYIHLDLFKWKISWKIRRKILSVFKH